MKIALVLQGGGTRCIYTSGVLSELIKENIKFNCVYGISAGGLSGMNFVSNQPERNIKIFYELFGNSSFAKPYNVITKLSLLDYDVLFKKLAKSIPFDEKTFFESDVDLAVGCTSIKDATIKYFYKSKESRNDFYKALRASASLAPLAKHVRIHGIPYVDGGDVDIIPFKKAIEDGYDKIIVITTRMLNFRKKSYRNKIETFIHKIVYWARPKYRKYTLNESWKNNNNEYLEIEKHRSNRKLFIIEPHEDVKIGSIEKDFNKYKYYYDMGIEDYKKIRKDLLEYLNN